MVKITSQTAALRAPKGTHSTSCKGLQLRVQQQGISASWVCRYTFEGKQRDRGLGEIQLTPFLEACDEVNRVRKLARQGINAFARQAVTKAPSFSELAKQVHENLKPTFRNAKHSGQWSSTLMRFANPLIGDLSVDQIGQQEILRVMNQQITNKSTGVTGNFWIVSNVTANRTLNRIAKVLDVATSQGHRSGDNPATVIRRANVLPKVRTLASDAHHAALPWRDLPAFWAALNERTDTSADALRFLILAAARTSEVLGMTWGEIDLDARVWTIPAERMKAGRAHTVPLSLQAVDLLKDRAEKAGSVGLVFQGRKAGRPLSKISMVLDRMGRADTTVHGFRSSFRDWAGDSGVDRVVAEMCLAHQIGNKVEQSYARSSMIERRRITLQSWADHATGAGSASVTKLHGVR